MDYRPLLLVIAVAACGQAGTSSSAPENAADEVASTANLSGNITAARPDDRTPLEEPNGPIDPRIAEAAGQVVQSFGALIEQKRWAEAEALWGDAATAGRFVAGLKPNRDTHIEIGRPGDPEGAAGSIYVTMPIIFYGKDRAGAFRTGADVILRRVNDVPGSTEAQRRWHIERIETRPRV